MEGGARAIGSVAASAVSGGTNIDSFPGEADKGSKGWLPEVGVLLCTKGSKWKPKLFDLVFSGKERECASRW